MSNPFGAPNEPLAAPVPADPSSPTDLPLVDSQQGTSIVAQGLGFGPGGGMVLQGLLAVDPTIYTATQFRIDFPVFADKTKFPDGLVNFYLNFALLMLNANRWGPALFQGVALWTAHFCALTLQANSTAAGAKGVPGQAVGVLTSGSVDKVSYGRDVSKVMEDNAGHWNLTTYGLIFIRFARMFGTGPIQLGTPAGGCYGFGFITDPAFYLPQSASAYANGPGWTGPAPGPW